jgi:kinesin family protein C1
MNSLLGSGTTASCSDTVLGPDSTQHSVFTTCATPLLDTMLHEVLNGCLFAFGLSGSGKTFSMLGGSGGGKKRQLDGGIPRIADELLLHISRTQSDNWGSVQFQVRATYLEV